MEVLVENIDSTEYDSWNCKIDIAGKLDFPVEEGFHLIFEIFPSFLSVRSKLDIPVYEDIDISLVAVSSRKTAE